VDDVIVHRMGEDDFLFVINAGTREKDISWVRENTKEMDCVVEDYSDAYTQLAIQGPQAIEVMKKLTDANVAAIKNYWFTHGTVCGLPCRLIARTGYTGEDGFEIYVSRRRGDERDGVERGDGSGQGIWDFAVRAGCAKHAAPRAKMALYGHEISETINVWEAGLDRYCKMEKRDFIGRTALAKASAAPLQAGSWLDCK